MLKLDHIAVMYIYPCYKSDFGYLEEHGIYTVQDFIDNFDKLPESMRKTAIEEDKFKSIERTLKLLNREDREPEIYSVQQYSDPKLNKVDKYNMGSVLPMFNPLTGLYVTSTFARYYDIEHLKRFLGLTGLRGKNFMKEYFNGVGDKRLPEIIQSIDMYTQQVERQAALMGYDLRKARNAFRYQEKEKKEIIGECYEDIIDYLISLDAELWYGQMSPTHIEKLTSSVNGSRDSDKEVKEKYTQYICNYTTLPELEEVSKGRCRALTRFVKPIERTENK